MDTASRNQRIIRPAESSDLTGISVVLEAARGIMRASGNMNQWVGGYPSQEVLEDDIANGFGHVVEDDGKIVGYFAFIPSPEPTYARIFEGGWLEDAAPYHVVHRIGSLPDAHGVFGALMDWCFAHDPNIRIDTHRDNLIMQHCIAKYGFSYCGIIYLANGDERLAYQKTGLRPVPLGALPLRFASRAPLSVASLPAGGAAADAAFGPQTLSIFLSPDV